MKRKTIKVPRSEFRAAVHIGATKESITHAREAILDILNSKNAGDTAKVAAFEALRHFTEVKNATVQNCNFVGI